MNICFLTNRNLQAHANMKRAFSMSPHLLDAGHGVAIILEDHPVNRKAAENYPGVEYIYFPPMSPRKERRYKRRLLKSRQKDDVVITCGNSARNFLWGAGGKRPVLVLDHPEIVSSFQDRKHLRRTIEWMREWVELLIYDGHLAVSRYIEKRLQKRLRSRGNVLYSPFAAEDDLLQIESGAVQSVKDQYGKKVVLYLGSFIAAYGFYEILNAAKQLAETRDDFVVVMAGDGSEMSAGQQFVAEHGLQEAVVFPVFLSGDMLKGYLHAAHAFICPMNDTVRDWARSPGKIYMYAATRRPIVTCAIGEAVDTLQDAGFYYEQGSAESMAQQIEAALNHDDRPINGYSVERLFWKRRTSDMICWLEEKFQMQ